LFAVVFSIRLAHWAVSFHPSSRQRPGWAKFIPMHCALGRITVSDRGYRADVRSPSALVGSALQFLFEPV